MEVLFPSLRVADLHVAALRTAADIVPNENEVMWCVAGNGWLYVIEDPERAGRTVVTISVSDLDQFVADLASRGISAGPIDAVGDAGRKANVVDATTTSMAGSRSALAASAEVPGTKWSPGIPDRRRRGASSPVANRGGPSALYTVNPCPIHGRWNCPGSMSHRLGP
jgi:hypothetical protein